MREHKHGELRARIWEHFDVFGETTAWELARELNIPRSTAAGALSCLEKQVKRYVHIARYTRAIRGARRQIRAVYALGDLPNAERPKRETATVIAKRWRLKKLTRVSSIFDHGRIQLALVRREAQLKGRRCIESRAG